MVIQGSIEYLTTAYDARRHKTNISVPDSIKIHPHIPILLVNKTYDIKAHKLTIELHFFFIKGTQC